jgi:hypothetical protein
MMSQGFYKAGPKSNSRNPWKKPIEITALIQEFKIMKVNQSKSNPKPENLAREP